ncbi:MAG: hypothetical protein ACT4TC_15605 [Myxococcaceae bacterium]
MINTLQYTSVETRLKQLFPQQSPWEPSSFRAFARPRVAVELGQHLRHETPERQGNHPPLAGVVT